MSYTLGIDVGNTYVTAALAQAADVEVFNFDGRAVVAPAAVLPLGDGTLTAAAANSAGGNGPDQIGSGLMSRVGNPTPVVLDGESYAVTEALGALLHDVVTQVTESQGEAPDHVVLTHPASWGPFRRLLFEEAARQADLHDAFMVTEPEAAAAYYSASHRWDNGDTVAVYDLGGTTFNATVLLKQSGGVHILGEPERVERLGGNDLDEAILSHVDDAIDGALSDLDPTRLADIAAHAGVRQECSRVKEALSADPEVAFRVLLPHQSFDLRLARSDFDEMVHKPIEATIDALSRTLRSAEVEPTDLSAVLLVGGSSRIPLIAQTVSAKLGCRTIMDSHPQHTVALGATLAAHTAHADGRRQDGKRLAGKSTSTSTVTAKKTVSLAEQRKGQIRIPEQRTSAKIPAQRTSPRQATPAAARTATGVHRGGAEMRTVPTAAPVVPLRFPRRPGSVAAPPLRPVGAAPPAARPAGKKGFPSIRRAVAKRVAQPRLLIGTGMAIALTGSILLALFGGKSSPQVAAPSALARPPDPKATAMVDLRPETAIPAVAATIPLEQSPTFVTVSPDGKHAYVANAGTQTVTVLDTADKHVVATIPISAGPPQFLALAPDGRALYVSIFNAQRTIHSIDVLDTGSNSVIATIEQPARPYLAAVSPDGQRLYVPNHDVAAVSVIDIAAKAVIAQIAVAPNPHWVDFSPDGRLAYTANHESNLVSAIDTTTLGVVATVAVGRSPHSVAVNPRRPLVANVNFDSGSVSVIDTNTRQVVATIPVGQNPQDIEWAPDGRFAYAVNQGSNTVSVIDSTTNQVTTTIPTGPGPTSISVVPNSRQAYVSDSDGKTLTVLDLAR